MSESVFDSTPWSAVLQAAGEDPERARRAFERLCAAYRDAIAHWMLLQGLSQEDAEDAAHDFLHQWLRRENPLRGFQRGQVPFRAFLRVCLKNFLGRWRVRCATPEHTPLENNKEVPDGADSHAQFDYVVARQIHADTLAVLRIQWQDKLPDGRFERLQAVALGAATHPGEKALAGEWGVTSSVVKTWIFRFRREYHDTFRRAVSCQADPEAIDRDVVHLHGLLIHPPR